jgi:hypothetical protein
MFILDYFKLFDKTAKLIIYSFSAIMFVVSTVLLLFTIHSRSKEMKEINESNIDSLINKFKNMPGAGQYTKKIKQNPELEKLLGGLLKCVMKLTFIIENVILFIGSIWFSIGAINNYPPMANIFYDMATNGVLIIIICLLLFTLIYIYSIVNPGANNEIIKSIDKFFNESRIVIVLSICFLLFVPSVFLILFNQKRGKIMKLILDIFYINICGGITVGTIALPFLVNVGIFLDEMRNEEKDILEQNSTGMAFVGGKKSPRSKCRS